MFDSKLVLNQDSWWNYSEVSRPITSVVHVVYPVCFLNSMAMPWWQISAFKYQRPSQSTVGQPNKIVNPVVGESFFFHLKLIINHHTFFSSGTVCRPLSLLMNSFAVPVLLLNSCRTLRRATKKLLWQRGNYSTSYFHWSSSIGTTRPKTVCVCQTHATLATALDHRLTWLILVAIGEGRF